MKNRSSKMKEVMWAVLLLAIAMNVGAQKIKIDNGTVMMDKVAVLKVEGKVGLFKAMNLTYKSMEDQPVLSIREKVFNYFLPTYEPLNFYDITFHQADQRMSFVAKGRLISEKKVSQWLFVEMTPSLLKDNKIDSTTVNAFIKANDANEKINRDTLDYIAFEAALRDQLRANLPRDYSKSVNFLAGKSEGFYGGASTTFNIYQGDAVIGKVVREIKHATPQNEVQFTIYKKLATPINERGQMVDYGVVAFTEMSGGTKDITTIQDKKTHRLDYFIGENSYQQLVQFLIKNSYL